VLSELVQREGFKAIARDMYGKENIYIHMAGVRGV
jgi:hypothetical protein